MLELADVHGTVVENTVFVGKVDSDRLGENKSLIYYAFVKARDRKYLKKVKVLPGIFQHDMVVLDVVSEE